ncbi:LIV-II [Alloiococcus otitis]|uniref:Branched-chain amino acid transport system carrier protein n=1 Tax=Alloiococcus otitis ATCC 51267 TaxID=883081 RepID=K9EPV5_9LACT|nr:branched-chain amino acid transport system II carrier protein [Alloiococcus otitis]EKU92917.1 branched-chain amino acid transport system II carrier protein [Alloiococcus otitis ATCC 51267]SUU80428.1 LIV-II [Alloiococcus otitis]
MKWRQVITVGFMLFAMYFGAGNLIFPPVVGFNAGDFFWPAIIGFVLTGVGLPLIGTATGALSSGGYREALKKINPVFSVVLLVVIYLTIGPFFAVPRTATTAYELGVLPFLSENTGLALLITSIIFFAATLYLALNPDNLANNIGNYLTPILLATVTIVVVRVIFLATSYDGSSSINNFGDGGAFAYGFTEGYLTMDAIAAIAFAILVINAIKGMGISDNHEIFKGTVKASLIAALLLSLVYGSLAWIGNNVLISNELPLDQNLGAAMLQYLSSEALGSAGVILLGLVVLVACLTTSSGLISACAEYFNSLLPNISYNTFAVIFTLISFVLANQGLDTIIETSVPVLSLIYPVAMSSVFLLLVSNYLPLPKIAFHLPLVLVFISSLLGLLYRQKFVSWSWITSQPFFESELEWLPILVIGFLVGYLVGKLVNQPTVSFSQEH